MCTVPVDKEDPLKISAELDEQLDPFRATIEEIQNSDEAEILASALLQARRNPCDLLKIAFSHGVMVGMQMEKSDTAPCSI
jgi:hypothetical protein